MSATAASLCATMRRLLSSLALTTPFLLAMAGDLKAAPTFNLGWNGSAWVDTTGNHTVANTGGVGHAIIEGRNAATFNGTQWLAVTDSVSGGFVIPNGEVYTIDVTFRSDKHEIRDSPYADRMHLFGVGGGNTNFDMDWNDSDVAVPNVWAYWNGSGGNNIIRSGTDFIDGNIHALRFERNSVGAASLWIDGVLIGTVAGGVTGIGTNTDPLYIGRASGAYGDGFAFPWFGEVLTFSVNDAALGAPAPVPEPATLALLAAGGTAALARRRRS